MEKLEELAARRWAKGRAEYGPTWAGYTWPDGAPNPLREAMDEQADTLNYLRKAHDLGQLDERTLQKLIAYVCLVGGAIDQVLSDLQPSQNSEPGSD